MSKWNDDSPATATPLEWNPALEVHPPEAIESLDAEASGALDDRKARDLPEPEVIPRELTGRWIAWSPDGLRIVGHGATPAEAREDAGVPTGAVQKVPSPGRRHAEHAGRSDS